MGRPLLAVLCAALSFPAAQASDHAVSAAASLQRPSPSIGGSGDDALRATLLMPDGGWLLAGEDSADASAPGSGVGAQGFVRRYDAAGRSLWQLHLDTPGSDEVGALALQADGTILAAGTTTDRFPGWTSGGGSDGFLARIDPDGTLLDITQFGDTREQRVRAVTALPQGRVAIGGYDDLLLAGTAVLDFENSSVAVLVPDEQGGLVLGPWLRTRIAPSDFVLALTAAPDSTGDLIVATTIRATFVAGGGIVVARIEQNGNERWSRQLSTHGFDTATALRQGPNGSVLLAGAVVSQLGGPPTGDSDPVLVSLNAIDGSTRWSLRQPLGDGAWVSDLARIDDEWVVSGLVDRLPDTPDGQAFSYPFALHVDSRGEPTDVWMGPLSETGALLLEVFALPAGRRGSPRVGFSADPLGGLPTRGGIDYFVLPRRALGRP